MGRRYTVTFSGTVITSAQDLFTLSATGSMAIALRTLELACVSSGQSAVELLPISIKRMRATVTVGSGGSARTPEPINPNDAAAIFTARINDATARATTSSSAQHLYETGLNVVNGLPLQLEPLSVMIARLNEAIVVGLDVAPVGSRIMNGTVIVEELF